MKVFCVLVALLLVATFAFSAPDCAVGRFEVGGPASQFPSSERMSAIPVWFFVKGAEHYVSRVPAADATFREFIEIKDDTLIAIVREFKTDRTQDVIDALLQRYGEPETPRGQWLKRSGFSSDRNRLTWFDKTCGLRVDAFPSIDPTDKDERSVVVWTKGSNIPAMPADDAIR